MLNVYELERTWLKYKIRRYLPVAVATVSVTVLGISTLIFWPSETTTVVPVQQLSTPTEAAPETVKPAPAAAAPTAVVAEKSKVPAAVAETGASQKLTPSMSFMQSLEEESMPYYGAEYETGMVPQNVTTVAIAVPKPAVGTSDNMPVTAANEPENLAADTETATPVPEQHKAPTVSITPKDANDLHDVIKRFKTNKNPALSLFLARRYYDLGEYQSAYDYALQTNELDSNIEESWLIFAKSLIKKGEQEQALKVLRSYIQHSNSIRAKSLLESIQKGTFQ